jgi:hypothetical protein
VYCFVAVDGNTVEINEEPTNKIMREKKKSKRMRRRKQGMVWRKRKGTNEK